jgi:hypothetical protein
MLTWIRENAVLFSLAASLVLVMSGGGVAYYQLTVLIEEQKANEQHIHDPLRHIDPMRDGMSQKHLVERLERLEDQVRRMELRQRLERDRGRGTGDSERTR